MSAGLHDTSQAVHQRFHWPVRGPGNGERGRPAGLEQDGQVTMPHQAWDADRDGLPSSTDTELLAEADGFLQGRFLMTPLAGAHPTREQRLVAVALADQAGAALANSRRR